MVVFALLLLPFAGRPWPNVPGFLPIYQTAMVGTCLITGYLMYGHFRATGITPLLYLCAAYLYTACALTLQMLSLQGVWSEGAGLLGGPQANSWLTFFWVLGLTLGVLLFALSLGRGSNAGTEGRRWAEFKTALVLVAAVTATATLTLGLESRLPVINVSGDISRVTSTGLAPMLLLLLVAALAVLWRASRFRNVLHVWLGVVVIALLCSVALTMAGGHQLTLGWYMGRLYALLGFSVIGFIYLRAIHQAHRLNLAVSEELAVSNSVLDEEVRHRTAYALQLEEAGHRKDEFLAMLAHELRNPLAPIRTASDLLAEGYSDEALVRNVSSMLNRQVMQMSRLVDDLMDMSRVARGGLVLDRVAVDMRQVLSESVEQVTPLIEERRLMLETRICEQPAVVIGDHGRLVQVISNLLNNAAKYTNPGGRIVVSLVLRQDGSELAVTVSDSGIGMTPELIGKAFALFSQGAVTPDRARGGLGIGLALVKSIVELHHGTVHASSGGPGLGSEFSVVLPLSG